MYIIKGSAYNVNYRKVDEAILLKYLQNKCNDEESERVEQWSDESRENQRILEQVYYTLFLGDCLKTMSDVDTEKGLKMLKKAIKKSISTPRKRWYPIAAAFLIGLILSGGIFRILLSNQKTTYTVATMQEQRAQTILPDGSKVWLNASSNLTYHKTLFPLRRLIELSGEAYFEVNPNKQVPFIVNSKSIKTSVLGTKFNLRARQEENKVVATLLEGSVKVSSPEKKYNVPREKEQDIGITGGKKKGKASGTTENEHILKPGQTLEINTDTYSTQWFEYPQPDEILLWVRGKLSFNQQTLLEITDIMARIYNVDFEFKDDSLKSEQFTGEFSTDNSPSDILNILQYTNHFVFKKEGDKILLSKNK